MALQTFYYERRRSGSGRIGMQFALNAQAIEHSKNLAARFRRDRIRDEPDLVICVLDESGREIHREPVHPIVPT